ncbi:hypothetical protein QC762_121730 [Podospora pseudocomata]|uniref:3CxxC-type domain-containing protein n=1 Tax=Podospora pseudocomata TaxID=2093779 RepID=A0ABR0GYM6_9PEZI|nr:hypothetical protein QC762_121730 [Podospora pseudocomata]
MEETPSDFFLLFSSPLITECNVSTSPYTSRFDSTMSANHPEQTFPHLHNAVIGNLNNILEPRPYFKRGRREILSNFTKKYSTFVMANFTCENSQCSKAGWRSGKVTILIRGYENNGYHATIFNQRCDRCKKFGSLELDESAYIDRVCYRLKKWAGISMEMRSSREPKKTLPHKNHLCEGCRKGFCEG